MQRREATPRRSSGGAAINSYPLRSHLTSGGLTPRGVDTGRVSESRPTEDADALRRRLYAPGASEEDVARYRAVSPDVAVLDGAEQPRQEAPRRRRSRLLVGVGLLGVIALSCMVWAGTAPQRRTATPPSPVAPSPTATLAAAISLPVDRTTRIGFLGALRDGTPAGLGRYLLTTSGSRPTALNRVGRVGSDERWGDGPASVELQPPGGTALDGRITVVLVTSRDGRATWTAVRDADRDDRPPYQGAVGARGGVQRAGVPTIATVEYDAPAPIRLDIDVDDTVRWGVLVVFTE